jgi:hypothetical protein
VLPQVHLSDRAARARGDHVRWRCLSRGLQVTFARALQAYDAALAAWERSPTDARKQCLDLAATELAPARERMELLAREQLELARALVSHRR